MLMHVVVLVVLVISSFEFDACLGFDIWKLVLLDNNTMRIIMYIPSYEKVQH